MDTVRTTDRGGGPVLQRQAPHDGQETLHASQQEIGRLAELERQSRVEHVGGGHAVVDPAPGGADRLADALDEGGHVVARHPFDLRDTIDGERGALTDGARVLLGNLAELSPGIDREQFDLEPVAEAGLVGPHGGHLRERVPGDHPRASGGRVDPRVTAAAPPPGRP
jgi:hypothetical protein